ncbi:MAG TPA: MlaD family protein [Planctomycetota bacterium]|nr:MlaD family protein [Planctomycetota bacterium]
MHRLRYLVGSVTLVAAVIGAWWIVSMLRNLDNLPGLLLQIEFRDVRGLRAGGDVRYRGVTVGTVRSIAIASDGGKAVAYVLLDPTGAAQACVNSAFWIVTPRFGGLTGGATGLDTLVRDAYVTFQTPAERGSPLVAGSLIAGREKPPPAADPETLEDIEHGDLLMSVLVPENHGLRPGSAVIFRGMQCGDVRAVDLAADGRYVEVKLRIARKHRQTVTDRSQFWVARPTVTGALFTGFSIADVSALLSPYVSYYAEPGQGVLVQDGWRVAASSSRPNIEAAAVPQDALKQTPASSPPAPADDLVMVRITYAAVERDTLSADDPVHREGTGTLFLDRSGRVVVITARSLVDGAYTVDDGWAGDPEIEDEQIKVLLGNGTVLRAGRVWVDPNGADLAVLLLEDAPHDLRGTPAKMLHLAGAIAAPPSLAIRRAGPDGAALPPMALGTDVVVNVDEALGAAVIAAEQVIGVYGLKEAHGKVPTVIALELLPTDLRPN